MIFVSFQVRVVLKYRHCDGNLCIKVTDDVVVSKTSVIQFTILNSLSPNQIFNIVLGEKLVDVSTDLLNTSQRSSCVNLEAFKSFL